MSNQKMSMLTALVVLVALAPMASADTLIRHTGQTDPATEGWTGGASGVGVVEDGEDAWFMSGAGFYSVPFTSLSASNPALLTEGWRFDVRMKWGSDTFGNRVQLSVRDTMDANSFVLTNGAVKYNNQVGAWIQIADLPAGFADYRMEYNGATDLTTYSVDGVELLVVGRDMLEGPPADDLIFFGHNGPGSSTKWFASVEFGLIPEPTTTLCLLGLGGLMVLRRHRCLPAQR